MPHTVRRWFTLVLAVLLVAAVGGFLSATIDALRLPQAMSEQETLILGQDRLAPGAPGTLHVQVRRQNTSVGLAGAQVTVSLMPRAGGKATLLYEGVTDRRGDALATFTVPEVSDRLQQLVIETRSDLGTDTLEQPVTVERSFKVLLTTDKPIYQPGQPILIRALALGAFDRRPAAASPIEVTVADAKGNKVYRQTVTTSEFGVASWSFQLADQVNHGAYKITASLGDTSSETTVTVQPYVLPKFGVSATTDNRFYRPGDRVTGRVEAAYFFGKAVEGGQVRLSGWVYDVERTQVLDLSGETGVDGSMAFEFDMPGYFVASQEMGVADLILEVAVTDGAAHTEQVSLRVPVAQQGIQIEAVPESGSLKPGVENIVYLLTSYPDGSPAECTLTVVVNGAEFSAATGTFGLGELRLTPDSPYAELTLSAKDAQGLTGEATLFLEGGEWGQTLLLRPERATYEVGETLKLDVLTTEDSGSVYLDIIREGQTISTRALDVQDGKASAAIDLSPDLYGTLSLHAYRIGSSGEIVRDTRLVVVDAANDLALDVRLDKDTYRPGEGATLAIDASGQDGTGVQAALGLAIVDESVFALQEQDPGFARLYFLLEQELLKPKFDLHGLTIPELMQPVSAPGLQEARNGAAQASLAGFGQVGFGLNADSRLIKWQLATERQARILHGLTGSLFAILLVVPLIGTGALGYGLWKEKVLGRSLLVGVVGPVALLALLVGAGLLLTRAPWAQSISQRLGYALNGVGSSFVCAVWPVLVAGPVGFVGLAVRAIRKREASLGIALLALGAFLVLGIILVVVLASSNASEPPAAAIAAFLTAYVLLPLAFAARAAGYALRRQGWAAAAALPVALLALIGLLVPVAFVSSGGGIGGGPDAVPALGIVADEAARGILPPMGQQPVPTAVPAMAEPPSDQAGSEQAQEAPLLRQFFPETMYWNPDARTAADGRWQAEIDMADTITTWRLTALASTQDGRLGSTTAAIRVFQDFFVDIDLPVALTQGDEVSMPVAVYNYLDGGQRVRLSLEKQEWFEPLGESEREVDVAPGDVTVVYFPIRVTATQGRYRPIVTAIGDKMSDATTLRHDVQVQPNGMRIDETRSDRLAGPVEQTISIPSEAIPGTSQIVVKVYPGILSQVVEGLDALLRMPYGCFEQTSSTTYPNVLVLDYLKSTQQASPEVQLKAEQYINLGYQRLTTFEVQGGGFSLFGSPPADRMLTAYGLMEFADMARVHPVDQDLIDRAARWLLSQQQEDGSWENDQGLFHESSWSNLGNDRLPVTAYLTWALLEADYGAEKGTQTGVDYVREFQTQAEDPYVLALVANALAAWDPADAASQAALDRLASMAKVEGNGVYWESGIATFMGATGKTGSVETTALAAYAFLQAEQHTDLANQALTYLVQQKDSYGTWDTTQATVLTLKALMLSVRKGEAKVQATVKVSLNGEEADPVEITQENFDVVHLVTFSDSPVPGDNMLRFSVEGEGNLMYQVSTRYYLPWDLAPRLAPERPLMDIQVDYDRTDLAVNDTAEVRVRVEMFEGQARQAIVDLGVPPGFDVVAEDLEAVVARDSDRPPDYDGPRVSRFDLTGRQIILYLEGLKAGQPLELTYHVRARLPLHALTPPSHAYDYYNPEVSGLSAPIDMAVVP